jgi:putative endonuclease
VALPYNQFVFFVYMVRCADGTLYTGLARDPERRVRVHNRSDTFSSRTRAAPWARGPSTRDPVPVAFAYVEPCESLSAALKRERELKPWSRAKKEALIAGAGLQPS